MTMGKILVVDDMPDWRSTLSGLLSDRGYQVFVASNKDDALRLIRDEIFHVAILDVRLDDSDEDNRAGLSLMHAIRNLDPSVAVIILTGYAEVSMVQEALNRDQNGNSPAFTFLQKDEIEKLLDFVQKAIDFSDFSVEKLLSQGEKETVEFKSSLRWDNYAGRVNKDIEVVIAKTIAGMMNYLGGVLLIGVDDDGKVLGVEKDLKSLNKSNLDSFQLTLTNIIKDRLGIQAMRHVHVSFKPIDEKQICLVVIEQSPKPIYLAVNSKSEFWVRTGNSTRQLDVREATEYIHSHWG